MKSNIHMNDQAHRPALSFAIHDTNDWNRFIRYQYPDGSWQLRIHKEMFDTFATKVGFTYDALKSNRFKLQIRNAVTGKSRIFHYLGLDALLNIDHWTCEEDAEGPRVDLFVRL